MAGGITRTSCSPARRNSPNNWRPIQGCGTAASSTSTIRVLASGPVHRPRSDRSRSRRIARIRRDLPGGPFPAPPPPCCPGSAGRARSGTDRTRCPGGRHAGRRPTSKVIGKAWSAARWRASTIMTGLASIPTIRLCGPTRSARRHASCPRPGRIPRPGRDPLPGQGRHRHLPPDLLDQRISVHSVQLQVCISEFGNGTVCDMHYGLRILTGTPRGHCLSLDPPVK